MQLFEQSLDCAGTAVGGSVPLPQREGDRRIQACGADGCPDIDGLR